MSRRILIVLGHPLNDSLCAALAETHARAAVAAGHEVRWLRLGELTFDPLLHAGYRSPQPLEPDLLAAQQDLLWAEHLVLAFPVWWGSVPALLKGFLDRVLLPGFAFRYDGSKAFPEQLLKGRRAQLIVTLDTPPWYFRWIQRMPAINQMTRTTLGFCGIRTTDVLLCGPVLKATPVKREAWLKRARGMAGRV